jgi:hypothetical protein
MILKRIAAVCFAIAFLMAIVIFTRYGSEYISIWTARIIFIVSGALALVLNLFSFQSGKGKNNPSFNLVFWFGSLVLFVGLILQFMHLPYNRYIVIAGLAITGISYFLGPNLITGKSDNSDVLDDPKNHS